MGNTKKNILLMALALICMLTIKGRAQSSVTVDVYQSCDSGNNGDLLTPAIMDASSHGGCGTITATWSLYARTPDQQDPSPISRLWVSDSYPRQLPGKVTVNGVGDFSGSGTNTWRFRNRYQDNYVIVNFASNQWGAPDHSKMTIACFYTSDQTDSFSNQHDTIEMGGIKAFGVLQTIGDAGLGGGGDDPPYIRAHSCTEGWITTFSPDKIKIVRGKTYWVNLHYDGVNGKVKVAAFDPDNGFAQVGNTVVAESVPGSAVRSYAHFGNCSPHSNWPPNETSGFFSHILIDFTNAVFPLLPNLSQSQTLSLSQGWNWISFNVQPTDLSLNSVFSGILSQIEQVKTQTQSTIRSAGNWKGDLADMNGIGQYKMFKVKVSTARTLTITGSAISPTTSILLVSGWNWVAFLPTTTMPITTALDLIKGQVLEVKSLTQSATYSGGAWSGTLTTLNPGQGYAIKMSGPGTLTYPAAAQVGKIKETK